MPYLHADETPCAGPLLCAFRDSAAHECNYVEPLMEPSKIIERVRYATRDTSAEQELLAFSLLYHSYVLRRTKMSDIDAANPIEALQNSWHVWEGHVRLLFRTLGLEFGDDVTYRDLDPAPPKLDQPSPRDATGQQLALRVLICDNCQHTWTPGYRIECTCFPRHTDNWRYATKEP